MGLFLFSAFLLIGVSLLLSHVGKEVEACENDNAIYFPSGQAASAPKPLRKKYALLAVLLLPAFLSGCATAPTPGQNEEPAAVQRLAAPLGTNARQTAESGTREFHVGGALVEVSPGEESGTLTVTAVIAGTTHTAVADITTQAVAYESVAMHSGTLHYTAYSQNGTPLGGASFTSQTPTLQGH